MSDFFEYVIYGGPGQLFAYGVAEGAEKVMEIVKEEAAKLDEDDIPLTLTCDPCEPDCQTGK